MSWIDTSEAPTAQPTPVFSQPSPLMRYRIGGTDDRPGGRYYLGEIITLAQARQDGYRIHVSRDGWTYGRHNDRNLRPYWEARPLS